MMGSRGQPRTHTHTHAHTHTDASTHYVKLRVDDGLTWEAAKERRDTVHGDLISRGAEQDRLKKVCVSVILINLVFGCAGVTLHSDLISRGAQQDRLKKVWSN